MLKKKKDDTTLFFNNFQGEFLTILLKSKSINFVQYEDGQEPVETPIHVQAFFVDEDETYLYMGKHSGEVDRAIPKTEIAYVEITTPEDPLAMLLNEMEPESGEVN